MSKYDKVYGLLEVVAKSDIPFNFASCNNCVIAIGIEEGYIHEEFTKTHGFLIGIGMELGLTRQQITELYCGHLDLAKSLGWEEHSPCPAMRNKDLCLDYCRSLIETWEALDTASQVDFNPITGYIEDEMRNEDA